MTRPTLEIFTEDAGLYAVARDAGETLGVIGPMDDRDALMNAAIERWRNVDHIDLPDCRTPAFGEREWIGVF